jgi:hypothetical protein
MLGERRVPETGAEEWPVFRGNPKDGWLEGGGKAEYVRESEFCSLEAVEAATVAASASSSFFFFARLR